MEELSGLFAKGNHILFTKKTPDLNLVAEDPDDDKFIGCAVALEAQYIVSGDKALLAYGDYMSTRILSAHDFLDVKVKQGGSICQ
jgi:uncharacterized protein